MTYPVPRSGMEDLKAKHIRALVRDAEQRKVSSSTFSGYATCLTLLYRAIRKPQLVEDVRSYLAEPAFARRSGIARFDKSLEGGCKGNRKRQLPFVPAEKHIALVEWAKTFAGSRTESMIPRGVKPHQWKARWQPSTC